MVRFKPIDADQPLALNGEIPALLPFLAPGLLAVQWRRRRWWVYVSWLRDDRPIWLVRGLFEVVTDGDLSGGKADAHELCQLIARTGMVRGPRVDLAGGRAQVTLLVRGADGDDATYRALGIVDVAVRQVPHLKLGELLWRSAALSTSYRPGSP